MTNYNALRLSIRSLLPPLCKALLCLTMAGALSSCYFLAAYRDYERGANNTPWWCQGTPNLEREECLLFSAQLDTIEQYARQYPFLADFQSEGALNISTAALPGTGEAYRLPGADVSTFSPEQPQALLYASTAPDAQLVGVLWTIVGAQPSGFPGNHDAWVSTGTSEWALPAWIIRGYQNHPNVFAASHPCLADGVTLGTTTDTCYTESHTEPFEVLVTNSDGVQADGMDALVEALYGLPNTVVNVVAPLADQSAIGDATTQAPHVVSGAAATTASGKPATAVLSNDPGNTSGSGTPVDAIKFALAEQLLSPEVVISGINGGQIYSNVGRNYSGTIAAARAARKRGVPAISSGQGAVEGDNPDYPTGVTATLALLEQWRLGRTVNTTKSVLNINTPTCVEGLTPRGTLKTAVKPLIEPDEDYTLQDCGSVEPAGNISNDLQAFNNGFIGITDINRTDSLRVSSYNMGLALNFVPYTQERLVANIPLLEASDSDVICLQEVWLQDSVDAVLDALNGRYPHVYVEPPEQVFSENAACTVEEITPFADCALQQCPGLSGTALVNCATSSCGAFIPQLSSSCADGLIGAVGIPDVTVAQVLEVVTQPAGKFAFDGSLGLILASKYELKNREFQDFIDNSSGNHRGALYAEIELNDTRHTVGCTHPTANLSATISYPASGNFNSWEEENFFMQQEMINFANAKAAGKPVFFAGDFNCSIANANTGVDADFAPSCQLWLDNGFSDPGAEQLPCTFCDAENLILQPGGGTDSLFLDHIFVKNNDPSLSIAAERVYDDPVLIHALNPVSELEPEDSPLLTHPSDHFGVQLNIELP